jgi:hypothetical protein
VQLVGCYQRLKGPGTESGMKRKNLASWIFTMLISLGTFAGVLTAMGTLDVPTASTVAATAQSTVAPVTSIASSSSPSSHTSLTSKTPVSLASLPAGGGDDSSFTRGSSSSRSSLVAGRDN